MFRYVAAFNLILSGVLIVKAFLLDANDVTTLVILLLVIFSYCYLVWDMDSSK